jgi:hypothetical protein
MTIPFNANLLPELERMRNLPDLRTEETAETGQAMQPQWVPEVQNNDDLQIRIRAKK